jgi:methionyl-tRNA formyltransferase
MKLVFMGTPEFAVPALKALVNSEHEVICVYTQPPRPAGRGHKEQLTPIHALALEHNIPVRTPKTLRDVAAQEEFKALNADAAIVAAYGLILPKPILDAYKYGCINIHPSLLPRWRGAAPIQRTIMNGDTETAICIMQMDEGLDTGDVLLSECMHLDDQITAGELHDIAAEKGAELLLITLSKLVKGEITPQKQAFEGVTYASKVKKEEGLINFELSAREIFNQIRGLNPWPGCYFQYNGENIKVIKAIFSMDDHSCKPGTVIDDSLTIACGLGYIKPLKVQRPGKTAMETEVMLRGYSIKKGTILSENP